MGPALTSVRTERHTTDAFVTNHVVERVGMKPVNIDEVQVQWERSAGRPWRLACLMTFGTVINPDGMLAVDDVTGEDFRTCVSYEEVDHAPDWLREWAQTMHPDAEVTR